MAANVVARTADMIPLLQHLAAIELLTAAQAIDLRPVAVDALGRGTRAAYEAVRANVPMLDEDRPLGPDIERVAAALDTIHAENIKADIELVRPDQINQAFERVVKSDVRYRFVIDMTRPK